MNIIKEFFACRFKKSRIAYKNKLAEETGFILNDDIQNNFNYRFAGLISRAAVISAVTFGTVSAFMTEFNIPFDMMSVFLILSLAAAFLTIIQLNGITRLVGYILCLYGIARVHLENPGLFRSGIVAVINTSYELIRVKYKLPEVDGFTEIIPDRSVTIPVLVIAGSIIFMMLMWEIGGRAVNLTLVSAIPFLIISTGLFFGGIPNGTAILELCVAWLFFACIKLCGKSAFDFANKRQFKINIFKKRHYYHKQLNGKAAFQLFVLVCLMSVLFPVSLSRVITDEVFESVVPQSQLKELSDFMVKDAMILTFSKYKNYTIRGSISSGQLGQYSSVHPDYKPNLEVTYVPSVYTREYLKSFSGTDYSSDGWTSSEACIDKDFTNMTALAAKNQGQPSHRISIKSLDVISSAPLLPYYTDIDSNSYITYNDDNHLRLDIAPGVKYEVKYYDKPENPIDDSDYSEYAHYFYTAVPDANLEPILNLCETEGFNADDPQLDKKLAEYFQKNYTYTLDPGLVPWNTDFVNYFLFENKKGLCAHFASAGTLIYRSLGIPARYVEGYAIDYPLERKDEVVLEDEDIKDWYNGSTPLTQHPVTIKLSDFKAHAWVEIYRDGYGWTPVELTPVDFNHKYDEKTDETAIAEKLANLLIMSKNDKDNESADISQFNNKAAEIAEYLGFAALLVLIIIIFALSLKTALRHVIRLYRFSKRDQAAVTALYSYTTDILSYLDRLENTSFKAADKALSAYMRSPETVTDIVQQILYSPEPPDKAECENAFISLHTALEKIFTQCSLSQKIKIIFKI